jgi:hypothetical protein
MDGLLISVEREQLDHQRDRIKKILAEDMVSPSMRFDLEQLLSDISQRMWELGAELPTQSHPALAN